MKRAVELQKLHRGMGQGHEFSSDMWSIGCLVFQMATGKPPFESSAIQKTYNNILIGKYRFPEGFGCKTLVSFVDGCLQQQPDLRMTIEQARVHPFLQQVNMKYLPVQFSSQTFEQYSKKLRGLVQVELPLDEYLKKYVQPNTYVKLIQHIYCTNWFKLGEQTVDVQLPPLLLNKQLMDMPDKASQLTPGDCRGFMSSIDLFQARNRLQLTVGSSFIFMWQDYQHKFGVSMMLSSGEALLKFNDDTWMCESASQVYVDYFDGTRVLRTRSADCLKLVGDRKHRIHLYMV